VKYLTSEEFTNQFVLSLQKGTFDKFRERFRSLDVLLVDDVQLLVSKKKTQEEFLHTFNALVDSARQVVLGCDVPPKGLPDLSRAMVTRFMSGLVVGLKRPDLETRIGILEQHSKRLSGRFDREVLQTVAGALRGNARELIGALKRLDIHARVDGRPLCVEQARDILAEFLHEKSRQVSAAKILRVVASHYGLTSEALTSTSRQRTVVLARQVAMYLMRRYTGRSLAQVGVLFGKRSHATAKAAEGKVVALLERDAHFVQELDEIVEALEGAAAEPE
jgi:chromosomal replication initiator protein